MQDFYPNGGESPGEEFTISWSGSDQDGDRLTYQVDWSWDGGAAWEPLSGSISSATLAVHSDLLPGGTQCLARVCVTDGFLTAQDTSDLPFTVPDASPQVGIIAPSDGQTLNPDEPVFYLGFASDPETGELTGESLAWTSDVDGPLGYGANVAAATLSPGTHTITLTATDPVGNHGSASVQMFVRLTPISRATLPGDWNGDGKVDGLDILALSRYWRGDYVEKSSNVEELFQLIKLLGWFR